MLLREERYPYVYTPHSSTTLFELLDLLREWVLTLRGEISDTPSACNELQLRPSPARARGIAAAAFRIMLCIHYRLQVGLNRHPSLSPCRFLDTPYCWESSKSFGSYSTERLGYNLWLRKSLNFDAGMERCHRGMIIIGKLCFCMCSLPLLVTGQWTWGTRDNP